MINCELLQPYSGNSFHLQVGPFQKDIVLIKCKKNARFNVDSSKSRRHIDFGY